MQTFFFIRVNRKFLRVDHADIRYLEAMGSYARVVTEKATYITHVNLKQWEETLPRACFVRISKCHIVALAKVVGFTTEEVQIGEKMLAIGSERKKNLLNHASVVGHGTGSGSVVVMGELKETMSVN